MNPILLNRIKELTEEKDLSVRDLATAADCSKSAMQRYLAGDRALPTSVIVRLAGAFHVHPAYLYGWTDDRNYNPDEKEPDNKKKPDPIEGELSEKKRELLEVISNLSEREAALLLASLKSELGKHE